MTQTGIVQKIDGDQIWLEINRTERGEGEPVAACCTDASATIEACNPQHIPLHIGDTASVQSSSKTLVLIAGISFGIPLIMTFVAYFLAGSLFNITSDSGKVGLAMGGMVAGLVAPFLYFRFRKPVDSRPVVIER